MKDIRVGFVGLGAMGGAMARRIAQCGFPLTVWARRQSVLDEFAGKGMAAAGSVAELGAACDHVGLCVLDDAAVAEICDQLLPAMREGSLLAIHSTILPESCEELERRCAQRAIRFLDAPVDGHPLDDAAQGALTVMCGGTQQAYEQARPVLDALGKLHLLLGVAGAGQRTKVICNSLLAADLGLAHAAMQLGDAFGLDRSQLHQVVGKSAGQSYGFDLYPHMTGPKQAPLLYKDVGLLLETQRSDQNADIIAHAAHFWLNSDKD